LLVACAVLTLVVAGSALAAVVTCTGGRCEGTNDPDQITGTDQRDRIFALAGQDELNGGDFLTGQTQNDTYYGGRGEDLLSEFSLPTDASDDVMNGGSNRDFIEGNEGDDVLRGQGGSEHFPDAPDCK
jgi:Ca2+-binding RTX toxin-like protein